MELVAHGLWAAAATVTAGRKLHARLAMPWAVWWGVFPDVLAFGPSIVAGLVLSAAGMGDAASSHHHFPPRVHIGLPLYPAGHSLVFFAAAFGLAAILMRRVAWPMLGWMLHILIDIPTHSLDYYATRFLWPVSEARVDGIAWWTRWFWVATYAALAIAYFALWKKGWITLPLRARASGERIREPNPRDVQ